MAKPKRSIAHVCPEPGPGKQWVVYYYAAEDPAGTKPGVDFFPNQKIAIVNAVMWAKDWEPSQVFGHGKDGTIKWERTYPKSSDPNPPPGIAKKRIAKIKKIVRRK